MYWHNHFKQNNNITTKSFQIHIPYEKMVGVLTKKNLMNGIKQASPIGQTSCLEGFHSVLNQFSPKMIGYSYPGMAYQVWALFNIINTAIPQIICLHSEQLHMKFFETCTCCDSF